MTYNVLSGTLSLYTTTTSRVYRTESMKKGKYETDPVFVLFVSLLKVDHPVAECFERGGSETTPDLRNTTVVQ